MSKAEKFEMEGKVLEKLPNAMFQVELDNGHQVLAHISGKLRMTHLQGGEPVHRYVPGHPPDDRKARPLH